MKLAVAQVASATDRAESLQRCLEAIDGAAERGAEAIVFAEVVLDRFFPALPAIDGRGEAAQALAEEIPGPTTERLAERAARHGIVVVFNLYERDGDRFYDTSPVIDADGTLLGKVRMLHVPDYPGFHETQYYTPGDLGMPIFDTRVGKLGVAICYDRHYPEVWRALALGGAELVVIPQAGTLGEWPEGLYEGEVRTMAFQHGVWAALANRVGKEEHAIFAGESFVVDPEGRIVARGATLEEDLLIVDIDLGRSSTSHGRRLFAADRRPELYADFVAPDRSGSVR
ncbi:MAG: nitrilase-related carbon-nitrogen hydrolase [Acidobacteriota bacterium]